MCECNHIAGKWDIWNGVNRAQESCSSFCKVVKFVLPIFIPYSVLYCISVHSEVKTMAVVLFSYNWLLNQTDSNRTGVT